MTKRHVLLLFACCLIVISGCRLLPKQTAANQPPCQLPPPTAFVTDAANAIDDNLQNEIETKLKALKQAGKIDFNVVVVETTAEQNIFDYSLSLARCWHVGEDNPDHAGALLAVAINDRKWHIQISRSLEQVLSNDDVYKIGTAMTADAEAQHYGAGINKVVDAMIGNLSERRNFSISR